MNTTDRLKISAICILLAAAWYLYPTNKHPLRCTGLPGLIFNYEVNGSYVIDLDDGATIPLASCARRW